ncbi:bleomycin resistance protein [Gluconobacter oxydans]|uniref:VOC family protein n=1 Tax=Gluconobacter thailandicus TaxID=257438 RepID=UPI00029992EE|nr:VOC family protein [Gluconobacter thailandicus]AFW00714.1 glyoxalase/bleomycin resistance protein/dioxygenase [Gluconobacter oxydans H24]ANQ40593.1 bleomycin resistance protein [Gluconobacter oxydans]
MKNEYTITFFYYEDIHELSSFYEDILKFELVLDQGIARIYRVGPESYFGIVDGTRGHLTHQERNAVLLTIVTDSVEDWHQRLQKAGVPHLSPIQRGRFCEHFFFEDPKGYAIEIQRFHDPDVAALFKRIK